MANEQKQLTPLQRINSPQFIERYKNSNSVLKAESEINFAYQAMQSNSELAKCDPDSFVNAVYNTALSGISLNPALKLAYLVPRAGKVILDISYRGLLKIYTDAGSIKNAYAKLVYEADYFEISEGTSPEIIHKPQPFALKRGAIIGAYAIAELIKGGKQFEVMSFADISAVRSRSKSANSNYSPWNTDFGEMAKKTVLKRLLKTLPLSEVSDSTLEALNLDFQSEQHEYEHKKSTTDVGYFEMKEPEQIATTETETKA